MMQKVHHSEILTSVMFNIPPVIRAELVTELDEAVPSLGSGSS